MQLSRLAESSSASLRATCCAFPNWLANPARKSLWARFWRYSATAANLSIGDRLSEARVNATIAAHDRGDKVLVFKFKRKKQYKRTQGHRQDYTEVRIRDIVA